MFVIDQIQSLLQTIKKSKKCSQTLFSCHSGRRVLVLRSRSIFRELDYNCFPFGQQWSSVTTNHLKRQTLTFCTRLPWYFVNRTRTSPTNIDNLYDWSGGIQLEAKWVVRWSTRRRQIWVACSPQNLFLLRPYTAFQQLHHPSQIWVVVTWAPHFIHLSNTLIITRNFFLNWQSRHPPRISSSPCTPLSQILFRPRLPLHHPDHSNGSQQAFTIFFFPCLPHNTTSIR